MYVLKLFSPLPVNISRHFLCDRHLKKAFNMQDREKAIGNKQTNQKTIFPMHGKETKQNKQNLSFNSPRQKRYYIRETNNIQRINKNS